MAVDLVLWYALLGSFVLLLVLLVGWLMERASRREAMELRRMLRTHLVLLDYTCGQEFPQVRLTAAYLQQLLHNEQPPDTVAFREVLRQQQGQEQT